MKLSEYKYEADACPTKVIPLKLANSDRTISVGLKLLTVQERADALTEAVAFSIENKVEKWDKDNPICALGLWLATVKRATFSTTHGQGVPFATTEELLEHPLFGQENLVYLYDQYEAFEEENHLRARTMNEMEVLKACIKIADGGEAGEDFLGLLRPGMLRAFLRITAGPFVAYTIAKLQPTSAASSESTPLPEERATTETSNGSNES